MFCVPRFEPKFVVLTVRVTLHIQEKSRELVSDVRQALRAYFQQDGKPLNGAVRQGQSRGNERTRLGPVCWLRRRWRFGLKRLVHPFFPLFLFGFGSLSAGFVLALQFRDLVFASAFDQRQDARGNGTTGCLASTGKADYGHPRG